MKMELNENSGRVVSREEAEKSIEKHTANRASIEQSETFIQSYFFGVNTLKELVGSTPVKNILGLKISLGVDDQGEKTLVLEVVDKSKKPSMRMADSPPPCPTACI